MYSAT